MSDSFSRIIGDKGAKIGALATSGVNFSQIDAQLGVGRSVLAEHFKSDAKFGVLKVGIERHAQSLLAKGYHPSVVAVAVGHDPVPEYAVARTTEQSRNTTAIPTKVSSIVAQRVSQIKPKAERLIPTVTEGKPKAAQNNAPQKDSEMIDRDRLRELSHQGLTVGEIAAELDVTLIKVIRTCQSGKIFVYSSQKDRDDVSAILAVATEGKTMPAIVFESGVPKSTVTRLANAIVRGNGTASGIFEQILTGEPIVTTPAPPIPVQEQKPEISSQTQAGGNMTTVFTNGQRVAIRTDMENVRAEISDHVGKNASIISLLNDVVLINLDEAAEGHLIQVLTNEIGPLKKDDEWSVGELVEFPVEGTETVGEIAAGPYFSQGKFKYVVVFDDRDDMIVEGCIFSQ